MNYLYICIYIVNRDEYQGVLTYLVPVEKIIWSTVFRIMEKAKMTFQIEDYAINQSSLESVVLSIVKEKSDGR